MTFPLLMSDLSPSAPLLIGCPSGIWETHLHTPACPKPKQLQDHFSVSCSTFSEVTEALAPLQSGPSPVFLTPYSIPVTEESDTLTRVLETLAAKPSVIILSLLSPKFYTQ